MTIGYSDGSQYDSEFEAMLGPINTEPSTPAGRGPRATEKPAGEFKVDRGYNVPLIAAKTPEGIAIDHRVSTDMDFEGKTHDITPFLIAHENAEIDPMESAIKGGMEPKKAYELAHDKVANPAEAAVRNAYAIHNGLDVDKFNEAYWQHINTQKDIAAQPSDRPVHPEAHTTRYGLDPNTEPVLTPEEIKSLFPQELKDHPTKEMQDIPTSRKETNTKVAMDMEDTPGYLLRHGGQDDTQFGMVAGRSFKGPMIQPKPANDAEVNYDVRPVGSTWRDKQGFKVGKYLSKEQYDAAMKDIRSKMTIETKPMTKARTDEELQSDVERSLKELADKHKLKLVPKEE